MKTKQRHLLAVKSYAGRVTRQTMQRHRAELQHRLREHLDSRCSTDTKGREIRVAIVGEFSEDELERLAFRVQHVGEWEAAVTQLTTTKVRWK